jgi:hypothetical protein
MASCRPVLASAIALAASGLAARSETAAAPPVPRIEWDASTLTLVRAGGTYARMARLPGGGILCAYDRGGRIHVIRSGDNGRSWGDETFVCASDVGDATNAELLLLQSRSILLMYNERPKDRVSRFAIRTCLSRDDGRTWSKPARVYEADTVFENGCWEPAAIQLPAGEIQLFFANEGPYRASAEQEITLLRSRDDAATWAPPERVSFRAGHRDGMPVPVLLRGGKGIAVAIEDDGLSGAFKPAIVFTSLADSWRTCVDGSSRDRWGALRTPLAAPVYAGAPYLRQMPAGETVLSVQCTEGRKEPLMLVYVGDDGARNFDGRSVPFAVPPDRGCWWNSLFVKDAGTVTAVSGTQPEGRAERGIWTIDGRLVRK